jgi:hypothetical protein
MGRYYILSDGEVVEEPDHRAWSEWYEREYPGVERVARTDLDRGSVTTRFLALNMTLDRRGPALLFETRVTGGELDGEWERYPTLDAAQAGHESWVRRLREAEAEDGLPAPGLSW